MDKALKQRLTGAVILIALAIIFLPMLLDGERQQQQKSRIELPQQPVVNFPTRRVPIGQHQPKPSVSQVADETLVSEPELMPARDDTLSDADKGEGMVTTPLNTGAREQSEDHLAVPEVEPAGDADTHTKVENDPQPGNPEIIKPQAVEPEAKPALPISGGPWKLQVASFAGQSNAEKLLQRLRRTGYQAKIDTLNRDKTTLYRVLVPGYPDRSAANLAAQSISKQIEGVNPKVIPPESEIDDPPTPAAVASTSARWVVQVGSFGQAANAEKLVDQLKQQGYTAYRQQSGKIHKVVVGPSISRDKASQLRDQIYKKTNIKGLVKES